METMKFLKFELYPMPTVQVKFTNAKKKQKKTKKKNRFKVPKVKGIWDLYTNTT